MTIPKFGLLEFWGLVALLTVPVSVFFELEPKMILVLFVTVFALLTFVCTERERKASKVEAYERATLGWVQQEREDRLRRLRRIEETKPPSSEPEEDYKTTEDVSHTQYWEERKNSKTLWELLRQEDW